MTQMKGHDERYTIFDLLNNCTAKVLIFTSSLLCLALLQVHLEDMFDLGL